MSVLGVIIFVLVAGLTTWLLIDTIIWIVRRVKDKKKIKQQNDSNEDINVSE